MSSGADLFVVCKACGSEVSPYITECPYCGSRLRKRAPKLDKEGQVRERRGRRRAPRPALSPLKPGEMPGIRLEQRPWATLGLIVASLALSLAVQTTWVSEPDLVVLGPVDGEWWRLVSASFVNVNTGYTLVALVAVALFGWLLERRHGHWAPVLVFVAAGAAGMGLAVALEDFPLAAGGNAGALGLLCAWAVPDLLARRRDSETDSDLLGVAVIAAVLALIPYAVPSASWLAGLGGALAGLVLGLFLNGLRRRD
ncbi:MAG TPA: rhomboid family intramembrane serine protease [Solirubrobacteraceae bacterium]|nr:rhomboid family intramembrane serine protease [Solirubrobacteraceae bacterium]